MRLGWRPAGRAGTGRALSQRMSLRHPATPAPELRQAWRPATPNCSDRSTRSGVGATGGPALRLHPHMGWGGPTSSPDSPASTRTAWIPIRDCAPGSASGTWRAEADDYLELGNRVIVLASYYGRGKGSGVEIRQEGRTCSNCATARWSGATASADAIRQGLGRAKPQPARRGRSKGAVVSLANCSPVTPVTKRPPRMRPLASRRRRAQRISRHGTASRSLR
jgi:hypothetical protein